MTIVGIFTEQPGVAVIFSVFDRSVVLIILWITVLIGFTYRRKAIALDNSIAEIKRVHQEVVNERARLRTILDTLPIGINILDKNGAVVESNEQFDQITGGKLSPLREIKDGGIFKAWSTVTDIRLRPEDLAAERALLKGETVIGQAADLENANGRLKSVLTSAAPLKDQDGNIVGAVVLTRDITQQRELEKELKRSNAELQQFAYVASHDLQEPLRMVSNFLSLLERKCEGKFDPQTQEYIHYAVDGAARMGELIDDLLQYSRIDTQSKPFSKVDMNAVVASVLRTLKVAIDESGAEVIVEDLPTVWADETQIGQVMQNLLSNAIKFRGTEPPRITVYAKQGAKEWVIAVKDNGIGIDSRYFNNLFQMFQRLHTKEEYPGTGIGLAIAKKIVERHSGRIWVESEEGKGSTFYFSIPSLPKA